MTKLPYPLVFVTLTKLLNLSQFSQLQKENCFRTYFIRLMVVFCLVFHFPPQTHSSSCSVLWQDHNRDMCPVLWTPVGFCQWRGEAWGTMRYESVYSEFTPRFQDWLCLLGKDVCSQYYKCMDAL